MGNELKTIVSADTSKFVNEFQSIGSAAKRVTADMKKFRETTDGTFTTAEKEEIAFARSLGQLTTQSSNAKGQLKELRSAVENLAISYRSLTDEEKNSPFGQAMAQSIQELTERAGEVRDAIGDTYAAINNAASDTRTFDQIAGGISLVTNGMQLAAGATVLFGDKSKELTDAMAKLQSIMAIVSAAQNIQNALQKQGALVQGLKSLATKLNTALLNKNSTAIATNTTATVTNTIAVNHATTAVKGFNTKLVALKGAFMSAAGEAVLLGSALTALVAGTIGLAVGVRKLIEYFKREHNPALKEAYENEKRLSEIKQTVAEKTTEQMTKLDYYVRTLRTAKQGTQQYKDAENELCKMADTLNAAVIKKKDGLIDLTATYDNLAASIFNAAVQQALFEQNAEDMKKLLQLKQEQADLQKQYNNELKSGSSHFSGGTMAGTSSQFGFIGNTGTMTTVKDADVTKKKLDDVTKSIEKQEDAIKKRTSAANSLYKEVIPTPPKKTGDGQTGDSSHSGSRGNTDKENNPITKELKKVDLTHVGISWETLFPSETAKMEADKVWENFRKELIRIMEKRPLNGKVEMIDTSDIKPLEFEPRKIPGRVKIGQQFQNAFNPDNAEGVEGTFETIGNSIGFAADQLGRVSQAMQQLGEGNKTLQTSVLIAQTLASLSLSFAQAMTMESKTGVWGWIAAGIAGTAQLLSMAAQLKSINAGGYSYGGIIPGNSYYGDRLVASVNSGEMILNKRQQSNLFSMINSGNALGGGKVEFEIRADRLIGVQKNYNRKQSKF